MQTHGSPCGRCRLLLHNRVRSPHPPCVAAFGAQPDPTMLCRLDTQPEHDALLAWMAKLTSPETHPMLAAWGANGTNGAAAASPPSTLLTAPAPCVPNACQMRAKCAPAWPSSQGGGRPCAPSTYAAFSPNNHSPGRPLPVAGRHVRPCHLARHHAARRLVRLCPEAKRPP
jgi:hypothetical protein